MRPKRVEPRALPCRFGLVAEPEDFGSLLKREDLLDSPKQRVAACIPGYDSSGAQTRPCG